MRCCAACPSGAGQTASTTRRGCRTPTGWLLDGRGLGREEGLAALAAMNEPAAATVRSDGYVQDRASQWVAELIGAQPGERVADLCAAPGGKATLLGHAVGESGVVAALDRAPARAGLVEQNARRTQARAVRVVVGDGAAPPLRLATFDHVLVDAPCSGLGVLRRRADARWRVDPTDPGSLARWRADARRGGRPRGPGGNPDLQRLHHDARGRRSTSMRGRRGRWQASRRSNRRARRGDRTVVARCCCRTTPAPTACTCCASRRS